ncbi:hypothetical protein P170DRAFT_439474 [Aspergillus steynii IBT 23096]|uniref:Endoplasmic reticulum-based factor for assembly of V-ATPase n=1 Tax=Aspergillus steynii IBT 23096 TaxID=1392250 RepID=A0A2I2FYP7_9EURO|nr:uncharacterized protein P170DRAFT_439474 [Aspergillus steynii IBT 23096]PLB45752.1 hypothetical protein P170DRAFT_439474 [Aspergillus steynii IBT 23096]
MVRLVTTSRIVSALEDVPPSSRQELDLPDTLSLEGPIAHEQIIRLARYFRTRNDTSISSDDRSLNSLLRGTKVYVPPPPKKPEPSPEYLALKARLLAAAEADAYKRMTSPHLPSSQSPASIFSSSTPTLSAIHESKSSGDQSVDDSDPLTPGLVLNIFLSVLLTGFSVYWALTSFRTPDLLVALVATVWRSSNRTGSQGGVSEPVRVLISLLVALMVGVAEVLIYAIYLRKVEQARAREKRIRERKVVVEGDDQNPSGEDTANTAGEGNATVIPPDGEKAEIWGRGPNGGLRRRVRERWEEKEKEEDGQ